MADFEKVEYEFPDEKEAKAKAAAEAEEKALDETEIEIVDDTPADLKAKSKEANVEPVSDEEIEKLGDSARYNQAKETFIACAISKEYLDFLTLPAYERMD